MTSQNAPLLRTTLTVLRTELAAVQALMRGFETAVSLSDGAELDDNARLQGFDIALQILGDLEHLSNLLERQVDPDQRLRHPIPMQGFRLERVRARLDGTPPSPNTDQSDLNPLELF